MPRPSVERSTIQDASYIITDPKQPGLQIAVTAILTGTAAENDEAAYNEAQALASGKPSLYAPTIPQSVECQFVVTRSFAGANEMEIRFSGPQAGNAVASYLTNLPVVIP